MPRVIKRVREEKPNERDIAAKRKGERGTEKEPRKRKLRAAVGQVRATRYDRPHGDGRRDISSRIEYLLRESNSTQPQSVTVLSSTSAFSTPSLYLYPYLSFLPFDLYLLPLLARSTLFYVSLSFSFSFVPSSLFPCYLSFFVPDTRVSLSVSFSFALCGGVNHTGF